MAQARTLLFGDQFILLGNGASPETFSAPCGLTTLGISFAKEVNTANVPDCDDPDLVSWLESSIVSNQMVLTGSGVLAKDALPMWHAWNYNGGTKNARWKRDILNADGGGYYEGPAILSSYEETGERGNKWQVSVQITFDGKPTWTPA